MGKYGKRNLPRVCVSGRSVFEVLWMFGCFGSFHWWVWVPFQLFWRILSSDCHLIETASQNDGSKFRKIQVKKMSFSDFNIFEFWPPNRFWTFCLDIKIKVSVSWNIEFVFHLIQNFKLHETHGKQNHQKYHRKWRFGKFWAPKAIFDMRGDLIWLERMNIVSDS